MKMTHGSQSKSETGSFYLVFNITLVYKYEYCGGIRFFFFLGEYKLKINKNVSTQDICITCIFYYKFSRKCKSW